MGEDKKRISDEELKVLLYQELLEKEEDSAQPEESPLSESAEAELLAMISGMEEPSKPLHRIKTSVNRHWRVLFGRTVAAIICLGLIIIGPQEVIAALQNIFNIIITRHADRDEITVVHDNNLYQDKDAPASSEPPEHEVNLEPTFLPEGYELEESTVMYGFTAKKFSKRDKEIVIQIISNSSAKIYHDNERSKKETLTILNMEVIHYY